MLVSSPRTWGCFRDMAASLGISVVFPTHVGVFPGELPPQVEVFGLPHARGGVSSPRRWRCLGSLSSPRTWGCFFAGPQRGRGWGVFPTHVGVFLDNDPDDFRRRRLPHARGGVSRSHQISRSSLRSSPRTWGCFCGFICFSRICAVFPTHVGVFPSAENPSVDRHCLPHARGGVSIVRGKCHTTW